ncbi:glycosyltransferase [Nocardioides piscis]|uniref:Glycosyltransferase family 4 protein n=1 Tax=Nocardioides piscis TaxID=2714938 RepID=A0A6G7YGC9_9ACTN|nr:glycosyltransferase [Nocardioides piscis]QIK75954.1 glycosyltransferase family 4 protein [Nocardioides piscis]
MIPGVQAETVVAALAQRLEVAAQHLGCGDAPLGPPAERAVSLIDAITPVLPVRPGPEMWLFLVAVLGRLPVATEVEAAARVLELEGAVALTTHVLELARQDPSSIRADLEMDVVTDRVVISADYCAREDNHTGVQRVTRALAQRWHNEHGAVAVADIDERTGFRNLAPAEESRVYRYGQDPALAPTSGTTYERRLVVPFRTTVVFPEVVHWDSSPVNLCLSAYSGNTTCAIGYDTIPILSSSLRPHGEAGVFTRYLSVVKHTTRVAAISQSAANEFQGFVDMLAAQGLPGPEVRAIPLATEIDGHAQVTPTRSSTERPLVVVPGRLEAHKNVLTAVQAAHRLWQEGLDFEVLLLGGAGVGQEAVFDAVTAIQAEGLPIERLGWVSDDVMWQAFTDAALIVFISLHEGYGLPLVEAMSCGAPVLTSNIGSQAEIARDGGCLTVDPRSLTSVADGMRELITRPELRAELTAQIAQRPVRGWDDYAADVWDFVVAPATGVRA